MDDELSERLLERLLEPQGVQPPRGDAARRRLALADLVAVDHQHLGAGPGELPGDGEAREAGSADQDIAVAVQRRSLLAALGRSTGHVTA